MSAMKTIGLALALAALIVAVMPLSSTEAAPVTKVAVAFLLMDSETSGDSSWDDTLNSWSKDVKDLLAKLSPQGSHEFQEVWRRQVARESDQVAAVFGRISQAEYAIIGRARFDEKDYGVSVEIWRRSNGPPESIARWPKEGEAEIVAAQARHWVRRAATRSHDSLAERAGAAARPKTVWIYCFGKEVASIALPYKWRLPGELRNSFPNVIGQVKEVTFHTWGDTELEERCSKPSPPTSFVWLAKDADFVLRGTMQGGNAGTIQIPLEVFSTLDSRGLPRPAGRAVAPGPLKDLSATQLRDLVDRVWKELAPRLRGALGN